MAACAGWEAQGRGRWNGRDASRLKARAAGAARVGSPTYPALGPAAGHHTHPPTCVMPSAGSFSFLPPAPAPDPAARLLQCDSTTVCTQRKSGHASWRQSGAANSARAAAPSSSLPAARRGRRGSGWVRAGAVRRGIFASSQQQRAPARLPCLLLFHASTPAPRRMPAPRPAPAPASPVPVAIAAVRSEPSQACSWRSAAVSTKVANPGLRTSSVSGAAVAGPVAPCG